MGTPACTITSQTAHGGMVTVGFPQVLIGGLPAARIGDMHVCPMTTGPVPHVGGPFVMGSMTVLVGFMPQSRVGDQLVCVGPPDVAVMGQTTVLVGMAGAGGAAGAMGGISALGAAVPVRALATSAAAETAEMLGDGTIRYSAPPDKHLLGNTRSASGFPDLPGYAARTFQTAQPVDLPPGTTLYRVVDPQQNVSGSYWTPAVFTNEEEWRSACAVLREWNNTGTQIVSAVVQPPGLKVWMGAAARQAELPGGGMQVWMPKDTLKPDAIFQTSWASAFEQAQAAEKALQTAQAAANLVQQAAARGANATSEALELAQQQAQQAALKAVQQAQQSAQDAVQQTQNVQAAAQQVQQMTQKILAAGPSAAGQSAAQVQQQAQNLSRQSELATQQAQQSAQKAEQGVQQILQKRGS